MFFDALISSCCVYKLSARCSNPNTINTITAASSCWRCLQLHKATKATCTVGIVRKPVTTSSLKIWQWKLLARRLIFPTTVQYMGIFQQLSHGEGNFNSLFSIVQGYCHIFSIILHYILYQYSQAREKILADLFFFFLALC